MAYDKASSAGEVQSLNTRSIKEWIEHNKALIKAAPDKSIFYSGRDLDDGIGEDMSAGDAKVFRDYPIWKRPKDNTERVKYEVPVGFQTLEDVLTSIRRHPKIVDKDKIDQRFSDAQACFQTLKAKPNLIAKVDIKAFEERMSVIFAQNAKGDIKILDGFADDYGNLEADKIFIRKELAELMKNDKLSPKGKESRMRALTKYRSHFDRRYP